MFYLAKKPVWIGSNLLVKILKRVLKADKIGFAGTLDPLASGLMIIGTNGSSRLFPLIESFKKTYKTTIRLDGTTSSYDLEQPVQKIDISQEIIESITQEKIHKTIQENFIGNISQIPPLYSAIWVDGKRAYHRMRKGEENIILEPKPRTVHAFDIISYEWPALICEITVSHGTYIRSLARDIGEKLGCGGYLESLERVSLGHLSLENQKDWIIHNDISYVPITHTELFPEIQILALSDGEQQHLRLWSTPLKTTEKDGHYFVVYEDNAYGLLESKNGSLFPVKNCV